MKRGMLILALLAAASCSFDPFRELDALLEQKEAIDARVRERTDSLRRCFDAAPTDSLRWTYAEVLYEDWRHLNLDSCAYYTDAMLRLAGNDPGRVLRSKTAQVRTLVRKNEMQAADSVFSTLSLPENAPQPDREAYFYAAEKIINNSFLTPRSEIQPRIEALARDYIRRDAGSPSARMLMAKALRYDGKYAEAVRYLNSYVRPEEIDNIYVLSTYYVSVAAIWNESGNLDKAIPYALKASCIDLACGMKDHYSLHMLAQFLFRKGQLRRAGQYMNRSVQDAISYNYATGVQRSARTYAMMSDAILRMNRSRHRLMAVGITLVSLFLLVALFLLYRNRRVLREVQRVNAKYKESQHNLHNVSLIKDKMLGEYMELSSEYIYKVDENRSRYRKILKEKGGEALLTVFREPAFADAEFPHYWNNFDKIFLSIFPEFVGRVNALMQPDHLFAADSPGSLTTELRILALIRLGIAESKRISVILHISKGTVYTYRSVMRQNSLDPERFEDQIRRIDDEE